MVTGPSGKARAATASAGITLAGDVEHWPLDRVKPNPRNARVHPPEQVRQLAASILEYGFTKPVLVDAAGQVLAGSGALAAARKLGLSHVPVIQLGHLDERQRRAYALADNKLALASEWDAKLLLEELVALEEADFDLGAAGFSDAEVEQLEEDVANLAAEPAPARRRGRPAGKIISVIEFDSEAQRERWKAFEAWLRQVSPGKSLGAALTAHVEAAMKRGRRGS